MKKFISIFICVCVLAFSLIACCGSTTAEAKTEEEDDRFAIIVDAERIGFDSSGVVFADRETGVCYLWIDGFECGGITVMVDADGKPLLWEDVR